MSASAICKNIVLTDLGHRSSLTQPSRPTSGSGEPPETLALRRAELGSARFLSVREGRCRWAAALTIEDQFDERYFAVYHLTKNARTGWRATGCFLGPDRVRSGKPDPFLNLGAFCVEDVFLAGGRVQDQAGAVTRVELAWDDGQTLTDTIENGVVLFLGNRDDIDPATVSFYRADGNCIGSHRTLIDES